MFLIQILRNEGDPKGWMYRRKNPESRCRQAYSLHSARVTDAATTEYLSIVVIAVVVAVPAMSFAFNRRVHPSYKHRYWSAQA